MKTKWTYKVEFVRPPVFAKNDTKAEFIMDVLNRRGLEGWELINAIDNPRNTAALQLYFKKPI